MNFLLHQGFSRGRVGATMENLKLLAGVIIGTLILIVGVAFLFSGQQSEPSGVDPANVRGEARHVRVDAGAEAENEASESAEPKESSASADVLTDKVEVVEFSDFQCPACAGAEPVVEQLLEKFSGQMVLIYRHFPLEQIHPHAMEAAIASEVAAEYGKFFAYHDLLFARQDVWVEADDVRAMLVSYAEELEIDGSEFESKLDDSKYEDRVREDLAEARGLGLNSTPTFFVEGVKTSLTDLEKTISEKL